MSNDDIAQPDSNTQSWRDKEQAQPFEGRCRLELVFYSLHDHWPEEMDLTQPLLKRFTTHGLRTTVIFERVS